MFGNLSKILDFRAFAVFFRKFSASATESGESTNLIIFSIYQIFFFFPFLFFSFFLPPYSKTFSILLIHSTPFHQNISSKIFQPIITPFPSPRKAISPSPITISQKISFPKSFFFSFNSSSKNNTLSFSFLSFSPLKP